jgi:biotin carboxylase
MAQVNVVFVAPYFGASIVHCLHVLTQLEDVRVGVISHQAEEACPAPLRKALSGHYQVANTQDPDQLVMATRAFQKEWDVPVDRLLGYLEQLQIPLAQARDMLDLPGMRTEVARSFRDKNRMKEVLAEAGLPVARQARVTTGEEAVAFGRRVGYPIVVKPLAGLGTKDTMRVSSDGELYAALNRLLPSRQQPIQAEEFVTGEERTFETVSVDGKTVWSSSTYYLPGPLEVVETPWMQYCVLLPREHHDSHAEAFTAVNEQALQALGMETGLSHMEWFRKADGSPVISEVGARPPGVNIMMMNGYAHEVDFWAKWVRLMVHGQFEMPERKWACGSAFFRGHGHGRVVSAVTGLQEVLEELGDTVVQATLPRVGMPRSAHYEGEGYAVVRCRETMEVVQALKALITRTKITYR